MAYMNQEKKATIAQALKTLLAGTGIKYSLGVRNHSTIVMTIMSAPFDLLKTPKERFPDRFDDKHNYMDINEYYPEKFFEGEQLELIKKIIDILNTNNHDNSDIQSDYFDVGHYIDLSIGKWDKPFVVK